MSLQVKITGNAGEGKSTLARLINNLLVSYGLNVKLIDEDNPSDIPLETLATRTEGIKSRNGVIEIETAQSSRLSLKE
jgi:adenylylsulfate kinase-like enzyme